ncbi:hypothetical protein [Peribacillus muralis]|uniref:hypothetical protein n=1 Tax=Peribacillus muralis TaxID=264697 RepID=UPI000B137328|nr:hypothetical protein [Peribacillus muralis]MCK1995203.1 hypothetical protein [Peribacillus muralis]MCK2015714.1 hypothetical protein [Peribacillus muralis]
MTESQSKLAEENHDRKHNKLVGSMEYTKVQVLEGMNGISDVYLKNLEEGMGENTEER